MQSDITLSKPKVMIVNDHAPTRLALEAVLEPTGDERHFELLSADSGHAALRLALAHRFAVILMDISMPDMDGFETAELIHSRPSSADTPIIFITAHYENEMYRMRGYQLGAVDFLVSPVLPEVLRAKVAVFVELEQRALALEKATQELKEVNESLQAERVRELQQHNDALRAEVVERKRAEEHAYRLATRDPLTGLLNRRFMTEELERAVQDARRQEEMLALLFLDLDRFKRINDTYGHEAGDLVLTEAARRIEQCLRSVDLVARLGGDEFLVLVRHVRAVPCTRLNTIVTKIREAIGRPFNVGQQAVVTSTSIGVALYPKDGNTPAELMRQADAAMYQVKRRRAIHR